MGRATCTSWARSATSARPGPRSGTSPARNPNAASSSPSAVRNSQRCRASDCIAPGIAPDRSAVTTVCTPTSGPSANTRWRSSHTPCRLSSHSARKAARPSSTTTIRGRAVPAAPSVPARRRSSSTRSHRTSRAWRSCSAGDTTEPTWGERGQRGELAGAHVEHVHVGDRRDAPGRPGRARSTPRGRGAGAPDAEEQQVAVGRHPPHRVPGLRVGIAASATGTTMPGAAKASSRSGAAGCQPVELDLGRQRVRPRPPRRRPSRPAVRLRRRVDEPLEVVTALEPAKPSALAPDAAPARTGTAGTTTGP